MNKWFSWFGWMASLSSSCNFLRSSCKLLNGSSSLFTAACWFDWLMLNLLKQLTMVSFDTTFHDDTKCFIAWRIVIYIVALRCFDRKTNNFLSIMGFEASYYTLVHWLKNRSCMLRQENQVDVCEVLDFRVSRAIISQKGNLSALISKGWVDFSYTLIK